MDTETVEQEAKERATKHVISLLQGPDQFKEVDKYIQIARKKDSAIQTRLQLTLLGQLRAISLGLIQVQIGLQDVQQIKKKLLPEASLKVITEKIRKEKASEEHKQRVKQIRNKFLNIED